MKYFSNALEAKDFLAAQITQQSQLDGIPLSEIEQKMLYFTESGKTLPNMMEIAEKFDEEYEQDAYEAKIAKLVRSAVNRARKTGGDEFDKWQDATRVLKRGDHYITIMLDEAHIRPKGDLLKLWATGLGVVGLLVLSMILSDKLKIYPSRYFPSLEAPQHFVWGTFGCVVALYLITRLLFKDRVDIWISDSLLKFFVKSDKNDEL